MVLPLLLAQEDITLLAPLVRADQALLLKLIQKCTGFIKLHVQLLLEHRDRRAPLSDEHSARVEQALRWADGGRQRRQGLQDHPNAGFFFEYDPENVDWDLARRLEVGSAEGTSFLQSPIAKAREERDGIPRGPDIQMAFMSRGVKL